MADRGHLDALGVAGAEQLRRRVPGWHRDLHAVAVAGHRRARPRRASRGHHRRRAGPPSGGDLLAASGDPVACARRSPGPAHDPGPGTWAWRGWRGTDLVHSVSLGRAGPARGHTPADHRCTTWPGDQMPGGFSAPGQALALGGSGAGRLRAVLHRRPVRGDGRGRPRGRGRHRRRPARDRGRGRGPSRRAGRPRPPGRCSSRLGVRGPYLLTVSTLEPRKNLARLVQAYAWRGRDCPWPGRSWWWGRAAGGLPRRRLGPGRRRRLRGGGSRAGVLAGSTAGPAAVPTSRSWRASACPWSRPWPRGPGRLDSGPERRRRLAESKRPMWHRSPRAW